jgi:hypothetical protein
MIEIIKTHANAIEKRGGGRMVTGHAGGLLYLRHERATTGHTHYVDYA